MFSKIYEIYEKEIVGLPFVCKEGCAACCTQSVTMTSAEGGVITTFMEEQGRSLPELPDVSGRPQPGGTTNGLAACYLAGKEPLAEPEEPWVYQPCVFLADDCCTIYPARPFGCRSFGSTICCGEHGIADVPEWFVTLNTVVNQLIEHLDQDGYWGNMIDVLNYLDQDGGISAGDKSHKSPRLQATQPIPGFLIPPGEEALIGRFWEKLVQAGIIVENR